ncbi:MAG: hypothetical protein P0S96_04525 [Simkaniaceae bacterium]|nr:hypothetical protein [Candidatus Sacchlamyda saccharinae]
MQVSIQHTYTELEPLPQAREVYPALIGLVRRVALLASVLLLNVSAGATLGLANLGFTVWTGSSIGGVLGLIAGVTMAILMKMPTNVENYRVDTLEQIRGVTTNESAHEALDALTQFFYYPLTSVSHHYDLHTLYRNLATVGDFLDKSRPDAIKVWKEFLTHLNAKVFKTPDGQSHIFVSAGLLSRLSGKQLEIASGWLSSWYPNGGDLDEIVKIGKESFGETAAFSTDKIKATMAKYKPSGMKIIKNQANGRVLGYGWYYTEDGVAHIAEIARRPEAAKLNIGSLVLHDLIKQQRPGTRVQMTVRKNHPYLHRLKGWHFQEVKELPSHFDSEDGILLELDRPKYDEMISQLG